MNADPINVDDADSGLLWQHVCVVGFRVLSKSVWMDVYFLG